MIPAGSSLAKRNYKLSLKELLSLIAQYDVALKAFFAFA